MVLHTNKRRNAKMWNVDFSNCRIGFSFIKFGVKVVSFIFGSSIVDLWWQVKSKSVYLPIQQTSMQS